MEKPLKITICSQKFFSPYLSSKTFLLPSILFSPRMTFYSQEILQIVCWQNFLPNRICSSKTCSPKFPPQKKFLSKTFVPHFAHLIFIQKNLLPKFFLPRTCCQTFLLSIFLLTMKFYLQKFLQNIFAGETSSSQEFLQQNLVPKISSQENLL